MASDSEAIQWSVQPTQRFKHVATTVLMGTVIAPGRYKQRIGFASQLDQRVVQARARILAGEELRWLCCSIVEQVQHQQ